MLALEQIRVPNRANTQARPAGAASRLREHPHAPPLRRAAGEAATVGHHAHLCLRKIATRIAKLGDAAGGNSRSEAA